MHVPTEASRGFLYLSQAVIKAVITVSYALLATYCCGLANPLHASSIVAVPHE
jgi:hypothetical protein